MIINHSVHGNCDMTLKINYVLKFSQSSCFSFEALGPLRKHCPTLHMPGMLTLTKTFFDIFK